MSEELKVNSKSNKKIIIVAAGVIVFALALVLAITVPRQVQAQQLAEQLDLGDKYVSELDYEQAIVAYLKAIEIDPKCEDAYLALADIYIAIGEPEKAEEILQMAEKALRGDTEKTEEKKEEVQEAKKQKMPTPTDTPMPTSMPEATPAPTNIPKLTPTNTPVPTPSNTPTPEVTPVPTNTPEPTPTDILSPTPTNTPLPTPSNTPMPTSTPKPTPTNTPIPTPADTSDLQANLTKVELKLSSECFTYDTHYSKYVCTGLSEKGYEEYKKYGANYLVSIPLPAVSDTGREVYGFHSNSNGGYDLTEMLTEDSANVELVCPESYTVYYGVRDNSPNSKYIGKLKNVVLNKGLETIGSGAFYRCSGVEEIKLPETLEVIEGSAFYQCSALKEIVIPEGVKEIGSSAFYQCSTLKEIVIPEGVKEIGSYAFEKCEGLRKAGIPESVVTFGRGAFSGCKNLTIEQFEAGGKNLKDKVFSEVRINMLKISDTLEAEASMFYGGCFQGADVGKVEIAEGLEEISDHTFRGCEWLEKIELPNSILKIGNSAFSNCTKLKTVTISSIVYEIGRSAFSNCSKLTIITPSGSVAEAYAIENNIPVKNP